MGKRQLPGTLWKCHGAWHWRVQFPGDDRRRDMTLTMPFTGARIPESASESVAESAAWRLWEARVKQSSATGEAVFTVNDLCDRWAKYLDEFYVNSRERVNGVLGVRPLREMYGNRPVEGLTHPDMIELRKSLVERGYVRTTVNKYIGYVKRMVAWALDERLLSAQAKAELTAISPIKPHRTTARESKPVEAVPDADVEATAAALVPSLSDMVRVHRLTGMRPDEACQLNWQRIEKRGEVWVFRPSHKNEWRNLPRVVVIGPKAQKILEKYAGDGYVFSPQRAVAEQYERTIANAKCHRPAEKVKGVPRKAGERWDAHAYARAITNAAKSAGVAHWHPNQLRHTCATEVRRQFGIAAASAVLGHTTGLRITNRYSFEAAEDEIIKAATPAMLQMG